MTLSENQRLELLELSKPLIQWLNDNCHPHCQITVTLDSAELTEGIARVVTDEFIKD